MAVPDKFGENVTKARERLSWTQEHLVDEIQELTGKAIHPNTIWNIENDQSRGSKETVRLIKETITRALKCEYPWSETGPPITQQSLMDFINGSNVVARIDSALVAATGLSLIPASSFLEVFQHRLDYLKMHSLERLERVLAERERMVINFGTHLYRKPDVLIPFVPRGACIALLQLLVLMETQPHDDLIAFLRKYSIITMVDPEKRAAIIRNAFEAAKKDSPNA